MSITRVLQVRVYLSHVPCKFFRQGACQAGNSCPFSHATDISSDSQPCKYFQKGNCKFGVKCALAHILPDGRRVNPKTLQQAYQHHQASQMDSLCKSNLSSSLQTLSIGNQQANYNNIVPRTTRQSFSSNLNSFNSPTKPISIHQVGPSSAPSSNSAQIPMLQPKFQSPFQQYAPLASQTAANGSFDYNNPTSPLFNNQSLATTPTSIGMAQ
ncbi:unnamed protein product [Ambrosiozyma monospora]|uniref:Unnamed protein product n=1 Tax=Ambrosiozyma monospora TaxID=43982 RepID=A0A9W6SUS8_AMBMO|nr:unnamed protein product [Ambrosiozyma monospora]